MQLFAISALALALASIAFLVLVIGRRLVLASRARRREIQEQRLRPAAVAIAHGEPVPLAEIVQTESDAEVLAELLSRLGRQLRGSARGRIAAFFERRGDVDRTRSKLVARRALKRAVAARALGDMGSVSAMPPLLDVLVEDSDRDVRTAAAYSLGRLGAADAVPALVDALVRRSIPRASAGRALADIGPAAVPSLVGLLRDDDLEIRAWAAELIGLLGDPGDASHLLERLHDASAEVRERSARALGRLGAEEAADALRAALDDRVPGVRAAAAFGLGRLGDRDAVDLLLAQAREDSFEPAQAAAEALARIDPDALLAASELADAGPHLREAADLVAL